MDTRDERDIGVYREEGTDRRQSIVVAAQNPMSSTGVRKASARADDGRGGGSIATIAGDLSRLQSSTGQIVVFPKYQPHQGALKVPAHHLFCDMPARGRAWTPTQAAFVCWVLVITYCVIAAIILMAVLLS